jgi:branched-chain amino acid transport system permease protein
MERLIKSTALREILRPLLQIIAYVVGTSALLSVFMLVVGYLANGSAASKLLFERGGTDLFTYTLINLPQVVVDGVALGFVYAAIALGYTMVYGVLEFINFAHSEIFAIGAFIGVEILLALNGMGKLTGISLPAAYGWLVVAIIAGMAAAGLTAVAVERIAYRPLRGAERLVPLISAIGVSFFLQDAIRLTESLTTGEFHRIFPTFGNFDEQIKVFNIPITNANIALEIPVKSLVVIIMALLMLIGLNYLVNATKLGKSIRSVAQDRNTASLMGINVNYVISMTFLVGGALGGAAGVLFALKYTRIDPYIGFLPGLKAFTAAVLGGIGNLTGALLGGIVLGMVENFAGSYLGVYTMGMAGVEYKDMAAFLILILVLIFKPSGLLGEQVGQKA